MSAAGSADQGLGRDVLLVAAVVVLGAVMSILDVTVVNVAINTLAREFQTDLATIQWVATGYTLALATVIPLSGWAADRFGTKRLYMGSIALFHGLITPSAVAGATGAISTAFGFASGMAGFLQALLCAMTVLAASVAEIEHAELLVWWLASISLVCVMLSQTLLPRTAEHG